MLHNMKRKRSESSTSELQALSEHRRLLEVARVRFPWMPSEVLCSAPLQELRFLLQASSQVTHTSSFDSVSGK